MTALLSVEDLRVRFRETDGVLVRALNGVHFNLEEGEVLGVLGESGSGKSTVAKSVMRLLARNAEIAGGTVKFAGKNLLQLSEKQMNRVRGAGIAMISQEPGLALNPVMKVGDQIAEVLRAHYRRSARQCRSEAGSILERVLPDNGMRKMYDAYPHQLSGGQQQRVVIGQAIACKPSIIIADEPTASLDAATEADILNLFRELRAERKMSLLLITHSPDILRDLAERVCVMYAGRIVEEAATNQLFANPRHPYAQGLLACLPADNTSRARGHRLPSIIGAPPDPRKLQSGCTFSPRCIERMDKCESVSPVEFATGIDRRVACFLYDR
ncbi:MAG TPA: ABC transporter ATP-binding protein [Candidatus Dormibacteraeota bacterium]|nr:ABC transporter ATP-binding protein [Candidatus Dormibacteraeota bacterium]